jgi:translation elongation factor EF-G
MGELHLEIYLERIQQEYNAEVYVGNLAVAYRETIGQQATFDYRFKKQSLARMFAYSTQLRRRVGVRGACRRQASRREAACRQT